MRSWRAHSPASSRDWPGWRGASPRGPSRKCRASAQAATRSLRNPLQRSTCPRAHLPRLRPGRVPSSAASAHTSARDTAERTTRSDASWWPRAACMPRGWRAPLPTASPTSFSRAGAGPRPTPRLLRHRPPSTPPLACGCERRGTPQGQPGRTAPPALGSQRLPGSRQRVTFPRMASAPRPPLSAGPASSARGRGAAEAPTHAPSPLLPREGHPFPCGGIRAVRPVRRGPDARPS